MKRGVIVSIHPKNSKYGGIFYECEIRCEDRDRTLMVDPRMVNWKNWEEIIDAMKMKIMNGKGIVLENLKVLVKKGNTLDDKLDADVKPEVIAIVDLDKIEPQKPSIIEF